MIIKIKNVFYQCVLAKTGSNIITGIRLITHIWIQMAMIYEIRIQMYKLQLIAEEWSCKFKCCFSRFAVNIGDFWERQ